jgi:hypothetical protein
MILIIGLYPVGYNPMINTIVLYHRRFGQSSGNPLNLMWIGRRAVAFVPIHRSDSVSSPPCTHVCVGSCGMHHHVVCVL